MAKGASRARATPADAKVEASRAAELAQKTIESLYSVGRPSAAMRVLVHGDNGVGKTTFLAQCPGVIFLPIEDGASQYRVPQWKAKIDSLETFDDAISTLRYGKHEFQAVAIETVSALEELIFAAIENRLEKTAEKDGPRSIGELNEREYGAGHDLVRDEWRRILRALDCLRDERGMKVLLSCPTKVDTVRKLDGKDYQKHAPQLTGQKAANAVKGWCDYVLFFEMEVSVAKVERKTMAMTGERIMHCTKSAIYDAKCRGEIAWPDRLPLDERRGWATFEETARLILTHGEALASWLEKESTRALATLEGRDGKTREERATVASGIVKASLAERNYLRAANVIRTIDEEAKGRKVNGGANANGAATNTQ